MIRCDVNENKNQYSHVMLASGTGSQPGTGAPAKPDHSQPPRVPPISSGGARDRPEEDETGGGWEDDDWGDMNVRF